LHGTQVSPAQCIVPDMQSNLHFWNCLMSFALT
jgi:hypothetical protein